MYVCMYVYTYVMVIYGGNINEILMKCNVMYVCIHLCNGDLWG